MRIMGLDFGSKTVGVAVSDGLLLTAQGLEIIRREQENKLRKTLARIEQLIKEWNDNVLDEVFTLTMMKKNNYEALDLFVVNSNSSNIVTTFNCEEMDKVFNFLEEKYARNPNVDYDVCQLVPTIGGYCLHHLATSRILLYAMKSPSFKLENITIE
jgi:hypothetical protein